MGWRNFFMNLITLMAFFLSMAVVARLFTPSPADAQVGQTLGERQVIALEKLANELGRIRRDGIKCR